MIFYTLSLVISAIISFLIVREDIKDKKIRNRWIVLGFAFGLLLFVGAYIFGLAEYSYIKKVAVNTSIAFVIGFAIWRADLWPAGDSKLFTLLAFLIPLHYYWKSYLEYFPAFILLANTFFAFLIFIFFKTCFILVMNGSIFLRSKSIIEKTKSYFKSQSGLFFKKITNIKNIGKLVLFLLVSACIYFAINTLIFKRTFNVKSFFITMSIFIILNTFLKIYTKSYSKQNIVLRNLQARTNLSKEVILKLKENKAVFESIGKFRPEGLEEHQVDIIQKHFLNNEMEEVSVYKTVPFSLWLILGAIITVFINTSLIQFLFSLF